MKLILLLSIALSIICSSFVKGQFIFPKLPVETRNINKEAVQLNNANYREKRRLEFQVIENQVTGNNYVNRITKFNANGWIEENVIVDKSGRTQQIHIYRYNSNQLPKRITIFHPTGNILGRFEFMYDQKGFLLEKTEFDQYNNVVSKVIWTSDEENNILIEKWYSSPEIVTKKIIWQYTDLINGQLISKLEYQGELVLKYKKHMEYKNGNLDKEVFHSANDKQLYFYKYSIDTSGNLSEIVKVMPNGVRLDHYKCKYNNSGFLLQEINYDDRGKLISYNRYNFH